MQFILLPTLDLSTLETRPVVAQNVVRPSRQSGIAVAGHRGALLFVQREGKVLAVVDLNLKALVIDQGPSAYIAKLVGGYIGKIQLEIDFIDGGGDILAVLFARFDAI